MFLSLDNLVAVLSSGVGTSSYSFDFGTYQFVNLNDGAYFKAEGVQTSAAFGPVAPDDVVPEAISWAESNGHAGVLQIWSNGVLFATSVKTAGTSGTSPVVLVTPGTFIAVGHNVSLLWVADTPGSALSRPVVNLNCRRYQ